MEESRSHGVSGERGREVRGVGGPGRGLKARPDRGPRATALPPGDEGSAGHLVAVEGARRACPEAKGLIGRDRPRSARRSPTRPAPRSRRPRGRCRSPRASRARRGRVPKADAEDGLSRAPSRIGFLPVRPSGPRRTTRDSCVVVSCLEQPTRRLRRNAWRSSRNRRSKARRQEAIPVRSTLFAAHLSDRGPRRLRGCSRVLSRREPTSRSRTPSPSKGRGSEDDPDPDLAEGARREPSHPTIVPRTRSPMRSRTEPGGTKTGTPAKIGTRRSIRATSPFPFSSRKRTGSFARRFPERLRFPRSPAAARKSTDDGRPAPFVPKAARRSVLRTRSSSIALV